MGGYLTNIVVSEPKLFANPGVRLTYILLIVYNSFAHAGPPLSKPKVFNHFLKFRARVSHF